MAPHAHRSLSATPQSLWQVPQCPWFVLKRFRVHHCLLSRSNPGVCTVRSWTKSKPNSNHCAIDNGCPLAPLLNQKGLREVDERNRYWRAMHGAQLLWSLVYPLLLCASKQVVQYGLEQEAVAYISKVKYGIYLSIICGYPTLPICCDMTS